MIDWITFRIPYEQFRTQTWVNLLSMADKVIRIEKHTGNVLYEISAWDSIRSDSHSITYRVGTDALWIQGSPARIMGDGDAVFGSESSSAMSLYGCVRAMAEYVFRNAQVEDQINLYQAIVSRVDVTQNILLDSLTHVREALRILRGTEGGRYRVKQTSGDTVYWNSSSKIKKSKAYAKGPHLQYLMNKKDYNGYQYTSEEIELANRLLRFELTLGSHFFSRNKSKWYEIQPGELFELWSEQINRMVGDMNTTTDESLKEKIYKEAPTSGQGKSAYCTWAIIKNEGWEKARDMHSARTWYRNLAILRKAGLGDSDISCGNIVLFRRRIIECQIVDSWDDLRKSA